MAQPWSSRSTQYPSAHVHAQTRLASGPHTNGNCHLSITQMHLVPKNSVVCRRSPRSATSDGFHSDARTAVCLVEPVYESLLKRLLGSRTIAHPRVTSPARSLSPWKAPANALRPSTRTSYGRAARVLAEASYLHTGSRALFGSACRHQPSFAAFYSHPESGQPHISASQRSGIRLTRAATPPTRRWVPGSCARRFLGEISLAMHRLGGLRSPGSSSVWTPAGLSLKSSAGNARGQSAVHPWRCPTQLVWPRVMTGPASGGRQCQGAVRPMEVLRNRVRKYATRPKWQSSARCAGTIDPDVSALCGTMISYGNDAGIKRHANVHCKTRGARRFQSVANRIESLHLKSLLRQKKLAATRF
ncbi:hypothetical protein CERSUDRAFT_77511 [Gelatoporia subvermispora B]|uniref:Uncharacterized protein n=1 Tax=Ceriporiopsis subvermispora (strain B) TaxID=914234 RepID=M2QZZ9_CERS8|nr:hypothetical protein CERSUDRAFT_77511 [Gelatoporia subvermispora B]